MVTIDNLDAREIASMLDAYAQHAPVNHLEQAAARAHAERLHGQLKATPAERVSLTTAVENLQRAVAAESQLLDYADPNGLPVTLVAANVAVIHLARAASAPSTIVWTTGGGSITIAAPYEQVRSDLANALGARHATRQDRT